MFFNRSYWPDTGATGQLLTELAEDLVAVHGFAVTVITGYPLRSRTALPAVEDRRGVHVVRASGTVFDPRHLAGRAVNYVTYFVSACAAALRVPAADVVVAMTDPPMIGLAARLTAWKTGAKFVFLSQDVFPEVTALLEFRSALVDGILRRVSRHLLRAADAVIVLGGTMQRRLVEGKGADAGKMTIIDNWADCSVVVPGPRDNAFSRAHGLTDRFVVMHAGNIGLSQNFDVILDAAERLLPHDAIRLVLVGEGSRRAALEAQARARGLANVMFLPFQPREQMAQSYAAADVFLVTLKPGLAGYIVPSKLYTILAAGRPYIAAMERDSEVVHITEAHECGLVVGADDGAAMAAAILRLSRDPERRRQLGERAREAGLRFDRPRQVAAYARLFESLAGSTHSGEARAAS